MIKVSRYYISLDLLPEYIKLYVRYITSDYIPCSTYNEAGDLVMSIVDKDTFAYFIKILNENSIIK